jgi:hypothetical protein
MEADEIGNHSSRCYMKKELRLVVSCSMCHCSHFHVSLIFADKAGAHLSGAPFSTPYISLSLTGRYRIKVKLTARDVHSSLQLKRFNDDRKKFYFVGHSLQNHSFIYSG